ncbi:MAG: GNAT family N-acetyltransferase [Firmicutes bacterium]|nr:GNAT family N-acetyltransferase [Bacillota bacterium]
MFFWNWLIKKEVFKLTWEPVSLKNLSRADKKAVKKWLDDRELVKYAFGVNAEDKILDKISSDYIKDLYTARKYSLGIFYNSCELIGFLCYNLVESREKKARIGIMIGRKEFQNKGYGATAMKLIMKHLFMKKNVSKIELDTAEFNLRAQRCFEKCGFKRNGRMTEVNFLDGGLSNKVLMTMTKEEYLQLLTQDKSC